MTFESQLAELDRRVKLLENLFGHPAPLVVEGVPIRIKSIQVAIAKHYGITLRDVFGPARNQQFLQPRHLAMYLCRCLFPRPSLHELGRHFHRDHGAVFHAIRVVKNRIDTESKYAAEVEQWKQFFRLAAPSPSTLNDIKNAP